MYPEVKSGLHANLLINKKRKQHLYLPRSLSSAKMYPFIVSLVAAIIVALNAGLNTAKVWASQPSPIIQ